MLLPLLLVMLRKTIVDIGFRFRPYRIRAAPGESRPTRVAFTGQIMCKHEVIHKTRST